MSQTESRSTAQRRTIPTLPNLMARRIEHILLVASEYDSFVFEEDGLLTELVFSGPADVGATHAPRVTRASSGEEALRLVADRDIDLVITMLRVGDMDVFAFGRALRAARPELPLALLIANDLELGRLGDRRRELNVDAIYVWQGDAGIFVALMKELEDRWNAPQDTREGGVGVIILIEDSVRFRSTLLPILYDELVHQTHRVMADGINPRQRLLRMRARPKILVAETYEEAWTLFETYRENLFGLIADVSFQRGGAMDPQAGVEFVRVVKRELPDLPALLQSSEAGNRAQAEAIRATFLHKQSPTLDSDIRDFMLAHFGFGDFVFFLPDGVEVNRAADLREMVRVINEVPYESLAYHASRDHFSNWLRARTEFVLAARLRSVKVGDFPDLQVMRDFLRENFEDALRQHRRGMVEEFDRERFDRSTNFARIGGGSLGGKARGLVFVDGLVARSGIEDEFPGVRIFVPRCTTIGTALFDEFLESNRLRGRWLQRASDDEVRNRFLKAPLPADLVADLTALLEQIGDPLAVRSSSLLEDSQFHPFAGVYDTFMLPNNDPDPAVRLAQLCDAIRRVYASTYSRAARVYLAATPHHLEAQKMGVAIQQIVGRPHGDRFYPNFAGVVRSYNFYPFRDQRPEDGVAMVALGLGQLVVEGGAALRFCPAYPQVLPQINAGRGFLDQSQRFFYAIDLRRDPVLTRDGAVVRLDLDEAERDGTLAPVGSVWSPENDALYDGIHREGVRAVTFAHVLKSEIFPLAAILRRALEIGRAGMGGPVELEFAANLFPDGGGEFALLQARPYGLSGGLEPVEIDPTPRESYLLYSERALGNGTMRNLRDVVYVKPAAFDSGSTRQIAAEINACNDALTSDGREYLLIGPGRWGTANPWLGIPVVWSQISGARVIVETTLEDFLVDPSQGSHFFHNLTSLGAAYLAVDPRSGRDHVDWDWIESQPQVSETQFVRHVRCDAAFEVRIDGRTSRAAVLKPMAVARTHAG